MAKLNIPEPVGFLLLLSVLFGLGYLLPWTFVLGKQELFSEGFTAQLDIYSKIFMFIVGLAIIYFANYLWKQNNKYGDNIGVFNREETIFKDFKPMQVELLSFIVFPILFLFANLTNRLGSGFFGLKILPIQQFSPSDVLIVSTLQIPISENIMAAFAVGLIVLVLMVIALLTNMEKKDFNNYRLIAVTLGLGLLGFIWHKTAYPNDAVTGLVVGFFWAIGGLISILTGSFIPFLAMHMSNNFFIDFARLYTSTSALIGVIAVILGLTALYIYFYGYKNNWKLFPVRRN